MCVFMHTHVRRCSPAGEEGREGSSQPGKERLEVAQVDGRSGVTVARLLSSRLLYHTTLSSPEWPSVQPVLERDRRHSWTRQLCVQPHLCPLSRRGSWMTTWHLGITLGSSARAPWSGGQALACPTKSTPSSAPKLPGPIRGTRGQGSTALSPRLRGLTQPPLIPREVLPDPR